MNDLVLTLAIRASLTTLVGLVFLMSVKPSLSGSLVAMLASVAAGVLWAVLENGAGGPSALKGGS